MEKTKVDFEKVKPERLASKVAKIVLSVVKDLKDEPEKESVFTLKNSKFRSLSSFLVRTTEMFELESSELIFALVLIDRLVSYRKELVNSNSVYLMVLGCVNIATKQTRDVCNLNDLPAYVGRTSVKKVNAGEIEILKSIKYKTNVSLEEISKYSKVLHS